MTDVNTEEFLKRATEQQPVTVNAKKRFRVHPRAYITAAILVVVWAFYGFPSPETIFNRFTAADDCVKFAKEKADDIGWLNREITAGDVWFKNGRVVVELMATGTDYNKGGKRTLESRLCVVGGGMISLPAMLTSFQWR
jgi:hypothetical protein